MDGVSKCSVVEWVLNEGRRRVANYRCRRCNEDCSAYHYELTYTSAITSRSISFEVCESCVWKFDLVIDAYHCQPEWNENWSRVAYSKDMVSSAYTKSLVVPTKL